MGDQPPEIAQGSFGRKSRERQNNKRGNQWLGGGRSKFCVFKRRRRKTNKRAHLHYTRGGAQNCMGKLRSVKKNTLKSSPEAIKDERREKKTKNPDDE